MTLLHNNNIALSTVHLFFATATCVRKCHRSRNHVTHSGGVRESTPRRVNGPPTEHGERTESPFGKIIKQRHRSRDPEPEQKHRATIAKNYHSETRECAPDLINFPPHRIFLLFFYFSQITNETEDSAVFGHVLNYRLRWRTANATLSSSSAAVENTTHENAAVRSN